MKLGTRECRSIVVVLIGLAAALCGRSSLSAQPALSQPALSQPALSQVASSQDAGAQPAEGAGQGTGYINAVDLLPESTSAIFRIPSLPDFCDAWERTLIGQLLADPAMQPFLDDQRERARNFFNTLENNKIGLKPEDLTEIASGEVVAGWLSFESDKRRPYALCVIADIRGMKNEADDVARQIDQDLKAGGAQRRDVSHGENTIRVYQTKPKPGQLKVEEIAITWDDHRFIAADRDVVVRQLLDVASGKVAAGAFSSRKNYQQVIKDSTTALESADERKATLCWQWYAEPFSLGRILRELFEYDRRDDLDVIALLERQGFDVIEAFGGVGAVSGAKFDILHRGVVIAPGKFAKAARMLRPLQQKRRTIPHWPTADGGGFYRWNWDIESAFWAAESLVNDALGEDLFRPMIDGIRDDPEGPQIDIAKDFLPNLDDEIILVTDNTMPAGPESDRMLVALRVKNVEVVARIVQKAMEVEPDAFKLEVDEFDVWKVEPGKGDSDELDDDLAELGFDVEEDEATPLLNHWSIAVVQGKNPDDADYLMFSSHSELLVELGRRVRSGTGKDSMSSTTSTQRVVAALDQLAVDECTFDSVFHPSVQLRARYELLRKGELKESDSLIANLLRRVVQEDEEGQPDPIQAGKLPPFAKIQQYFSSGGSYWQKTETGWSMTGFVLVE